VTGGAGFIGSHLSVQLPEDGWEVLALDDLSAGSEANVSPLKRRPEFHLALESVLSSSVVSELIHRCDVVLAAAVGVRLIVERPGHTLLTNVRGTETVLEYLSRFEKPVLIASSSDVYGDHIADDLALRPALQHRRPEAERRIRERDPSLRSGRSPARLSRCTATAARRGASLMYQTTDRASSASWRSLRRRARSSTSARPGRWPQADKQALA
jgi:nucleoside-diphosphate-sugar epimerase